MSEATKISASLETLDEQGGYTVGLRMFMDCSPTDTIQSLFERAATLGTGSYFQPKLRKIQVSDRIVLQLVQPKEGA